jgi:hypothetical protein
MLSSVVSSEPAKPHREQAADDDVVAAPFGRYEPPAVHDVGQVRDLVKGSSASGNSDANSQYYW